MFFLDKLNIFSTTLLFVYVPNVLCILNEHRWKKESCQAVIVEESP
jgi:hypothetical protein